MTDHDNATLDAEIEEKFDLGYHLKLKRLFGNAEQVAATPKFVVLRSIKA